MLLENGSEKQARGWKKKGFQKLSIAGNEETRSAKVKSKNLNKGKGENVTDEKK